MRRVVISTSSSGLDQLDKPDNIRILRLHININSIDFIDGDDIDLERINSIMSKSHQLVPQTTAPTEDEIAELFYELLEAGYEEVFVISLSSWVSKTYTHLQNIKGLFSSRMRIHLFDTRNIGYAERILALKAAEMMADDKSAYEIEIRLRNMRDNFSSWLVLDDLRSMIQNQLISAPAGFVGNLFDIKPVLSINERGQIVPTDRVRNIHRAVDKMCEHVANAIHDKTDKAFIITSGNNNLSRYATDQLAERGVFDVPVVPVSAAVIAAMGSNSIGIGVYHDHLSS